jgi:hypothetical protein
MEVLEWGGGGGGDTRGNVKNALPENSFPKILNENEYIPLASYYVK